MGGLLSLLNRKKMSLIRWYLICRSYI